MESKEFDTSIYNTLLDQRHTPFVSDNIQDNVRKVLTITAIWTPEKSCRVSGRRSGAFADPQTRFSRHVGICNVVVFLLGAESA